MVIASGIPEVISLMLLFHFMNFRWRFLNQTIQPWYNLPEGKLERSVKVSSSTIDFYFAFSKQNYLPRIKHSYPEWIGYASTEDAGKFSGSTANRNDTFSSILGLLLKSQNFMVFESGMFSVLCSFLKVHQTEMVKKGTPALHWAAGLSPEKHWLLKIASSNL